MTRPPDPGSGRDDRCPPAADLTAFATGALPDARRAAISRHLLRCPSCRVRHDGAADVLLRLRVASAASGWAAEVRAAEVAGAARARARRRGALAGVGAAAALVAALLSAPGAGRPGVGERVEATLAGAAAVARPTPLAPEARTALLRAQAEDGRWRAPQSTGDHDEGATGLAVLALLAQGPDALDDGAVAQAVGRATRWLASHPVDDDATGRRGTSAERDQALATAALLEVLAVSRDATVRPAVDRAVRALAHRATDGANASVDAWTRRALARARDLGWRGRAFPAPDSASDAPWPLAGAQAVAVLVSRG